MFSSIIVEKDEPTIQITVKDTGIGMSKEAVSKAFDPFNRIDKGSRKHATSNGVGLSICKSICEQLGGHIEVVSTIGAGSTFNFSVKAKPYDNAKL